MFYSPWLNCILIRGSCSKHVGHLLWSYLNQRHNIMKISLHGSYDALLYAKQCKCDAIRSRKPSFLFNFIVSVFSRHFHLILTQTIAMQSRYFIVDMLLSIFMKILAFNLISFKSKSKPQP